jgi:selenocysteine lyase/cysteine desulfurase
MGVKNIIDREHELHEIIWEKFEKLENAHVLADNFSDRLGVYSFYIDDLHFNLAVQLLNDKYGIQVRGGCSCAGTYGHMLLDVDINFSHNITDQIDEGDLSLKPGWIRMSIHPTMTDEEMHFIMNAIEDVAKNHKDIGADYTYNNQTNEFVYKDKSFSEMNGERAKSWFEL